jgi:hypothetical protein
MLAPEVSNMFELWDLAEVQIKIVKLLGPQHSREGLAMNGGATPT